MKISNSVILKLHRALESNVDCLSKLKHSLYFHYFQGITGNSFFNPKDFNVADL